MACQWHKGFRSKHVSFTSDLTWSKLTFGPLPFRGREALAPQWLFPVATLVLVLTACPLTRPSRWQV